MTQARLLGGRYQVGELLGYGGMAEVHRGRDLRLGRDVAIKMLRTDLARDDTFQLRFRREAQNAASLNHPAIVAVYDTGEERGSSGETLPYIVMEFVNGRTLKEVLAVEGRLMPRRALEITAEICSAIEFSHRHGIIHRDIKPGNVMMTQTGQIKVMDFGIARALAAGGSTMTQTSAVIGTAQYLSPEQARGESVDARSDVYATGCVLYELLCGQPPFVGDSPVSVAYQHVREDAKPPSLLNRDVPPAVDAVVLKSLAKNPLNRYQSAGEMRADLLRAAAGRPVYAEPVMPETDHGATRPIRPTPGGRPPARFGGGQRRRTSGWAIAGLSAVGILAIVALVAGLIISQQPSRKTVPNLANQSNEQAQLLIRNAGLKADPRAKTGTDCTLNQVLSQDPSAGSKVDENSTVRYDWCAGPGKVLVPNLIDQKQADAEAQLRNLKLDPKSEQVNSEKPAGTVVGSSPTAGAEVAEGTAVTLQISKGNLKIVPGVANKGYDEGQAKAVLSNAGFPSDRVEVIKANTTNPAQDGKVIFQTPDEGAARDPATTTIRLTIGQYNNPSASPSVSSSN
jgi:eukaryotic-like serine/threonine-protein kinase